MVMQGNEGGEIVSEGMNMGRSWNDNTVVRMKKTGGRKTGWIYREVQQDA